VVPRSRLTLKFSDGSTIDTWQRFTLRQSFTDPLDDFQLETTPLRKDWERYGRLLGKGEKVTVLIDEVSQGDYLIVTSEDDDGDNGVTYNVTVKTPLCTPYEGDIDPDISIASSVDVEITTAILKALGPYGFDRVVAGTRSSVSALTGKPISGRPHIFTPVRELKHRDAVGHEGETAYAFIARIVTRLGCVCRIQADGTVAVEEPDYQQDPSYTVVRTTRPEAFGSAADFFIDKVKVHDSNEGQFSEVTVRGQRPIDPDDPAAARPHAVAASEVLPERSAYRSKWAPFKPKYFKDKSAGDTKRSANVAYFELGMRAAGAFYVEGEVDGLRSASGAIWTVNTTGRVIHERRGIDDIMWLSELTRTQDAGGGQRTHLRWIPLGALVLGDPKRG
jgi:prophage tail gpP-like protein